jgi:hypothetical protein
LGKRDWSKFAKYNSGQIIQPSKLQAHRRTPNCNLRTNHTVIKSSKISASRGPLYAFFHSRSRCPLLPPWRCSSRPRCQRGSSQRAWLQKFQEAMEVSYSCELGEDLPLLCTGSPIAGAESGSTPPKNTPGSGGGKKSQQKMSRKHFDSGKRPN